MVKHTPSETTDIGKIACVAISLIGSTKSRKGYDKGGHTARRNLVHFNSVFTERVSCLRGAKVLYVSNALLVQPSFRRSSIVTRRVVEVISLLHPHKVKGMIIEE